MDRTPSRLDLLRRESTSALICLPFLDTDTSRDKQLADQILTERGYREGTIRRLRRLAAVGLWYQVLAWDDCHLDLSDVLAGYGAVLGALGLLSLLVSWRVGVGLLIVAILLIAWAGVGWYRFRRRHQAEIDS